MGKINNIDYAEAADKLLMERKTYEKNNVIYTDIPYVNASSDQHGMDCQGLMEYQLRQLGVKKNWKGSNDMFRNACSWVGTIEECKKEFGKIPKGAWLFIVAFDGGEVARGYKDGLGNASHVGVYTGIGHGVVHASASRKCVASSTLKNAWTHVGLCKDINYGYTPEQNEKIEVTVMEQEMRVFAENGGSVNMRDSINGNLIMRVPVGETVTVTGVSNDWSKIIYNGKSGWMMSKFLTDVEGSENGMYTIYLESKLAKALKDALEQAGV